VDRPDLVQSIRNYAQQGNFAWQGEKALTEYFLWWFETQVTDDFIYTGLVQFLPELMLDAFEQLREGEDERTQSYREQYLKEVDRDTIPKLTEIAGGGLDRSLTITTLGLWVSKITRSGFMEERIKGYLEAQDNALDHVLREFNRRVYRQGLFQLTHECQVAGMSGKFGPTTLRTFYSAGRLMLTFVRESLDTPRNEESVSFVADYEDSAGYRSGLQSLHTSLPIAIEMINDVITNWPKTREGQAQVYTGNTSVRIGW
jgi:hypothetical protein